ncbi:MAG: MATE family efflux transporter [Lachnospira sp.]
MVRVMGKILYIGIPIAVQDGLIQVAFIVITIIANQRGLNDAAAVGIVEKIIKLSVSGSVFYVINLFQLLGHRISEQINQKRAIATLRYAVLIAVGFGILATITIQFTAGSIVALFTDGNTSAGADVIRLGSQYLRGYIFDCIFAGIHLASAVISVLVENPDCHSYITFWQLYWFVFREFI